MLNYIIRTQLPFWNNFSIVNWMYQNGKNRLRQDKMRHCILFNCLFDDRHQNMGCSVSALQNRRYRLVKQENVRLESRINKLYNETTKLKNGIQNLVEWTQPHPQGFSLKQWVGRDPPHPFFEGKALATRLEWTATAGDVCMLIKQFPVRRPPQCLLRNWVNRKLCNYWVKIVSVTCKEINQIYFKLKLLLLLRHSVIITPLQNIYQRFTL